MGSRSTTPGADRPEDLLRNAELAVYEANRGLPQDRSLARAFGLEVVVEGVKTPEEASELRALGCDLAQGYHFWIPAPG